MFKDNPDFYPTPPQLIRKMTSKLEWKYINSVLEPSAGKGNLVEAIYNLKTLGTIEGIRSMTWIPSNKMKTYGTYLKAKITE